jgi:hypothetical protein
VAAVIFPAEGGSAALIGLICKQTRSPSLSLSLSLFQLLPFSGGTR